MYIQTGVCIHIHVQNDLIRNLKFIFTLCFSKKPTIFGLHTPMSIATYLNNKKLAMSDIMLVSLGKAEGFYHKLRVIYF